MEKSRTRVCMDVYLVVSCMRTPYYIISSVAVATGSVCMYRLGNSNNDTTTTRTDAGVVNCQDEGYSYIASGSQLDDELVQFCVSTS